MSAAQGNPDWQGSFRLDKSAILAAWGEPNLCFAMPLAARLAERAGAPDFFLEFVSDRNTSNPDDSLYATLAMGLTRDDDLAEAYSAVKRRNAGAALLPVLFTTGTYWHLECGGQNETRPFAWEDARMAGLQCRLSPKTAQLLYAALEGGAVSLARAAVECEMAAFLPRIEATVTFQTAELLAELAALSSAPGSATAPFDRMVTFFEEGRSGALRYDGVDRGATGRSRGLALAGRVRHFFGAAAPCPQITGGPIIALRPAGLLPAETLWDLRTPLMTGIPVFLDFDPFTPVVRSGGRDRVTRFTRVPPLPDAWLTERVTVVSGLPQSLGNCDAIELTLRVEKQHSYSGATMAKAMTLFPANERSTTVELKFAQPGAKPYSARITVAAEGKVTEMDWFDCNGDYLFIDAERLPGRCVTARATAELLAQAAIHIAIGAGDRRATLTAEAPAATFLLPGDSGEARMTVTASDAAGRGEPLRLDLPCASVNLDLLSFAQYGSQTTPVTVRFLEGAAAARFEFLPESGDGGAIVLAFTPEQPAGQFSYFATRLFNRRYRFRGVLEDEAGPWSDYQTPGVELTLTARGENYA